MSQTLSGERRDFDARDAAEAELVTWDACEWPVRSSYSSPDARHRTMADSVRTCGRSGAKNPYQNLHLCWQHREVMVSEVRTGLTYGGMTVRDMAHLAEAIIARIGRVADGETDGFDDYADRVGSALVEAVVDLAANVNLGGRADDAIDSMIQRRLAKTWGAA